MRQYTKYIEFVKKIKVKCIAQHFDFKIFISLLNTYFCPRFIEERFD